MCGIAYRCIYQVSNWYLKTSTNKSGKNFTGWELYWLPLPCVFVRQGAKNCPTMTKIIRSEETHYISVCTKSEASIQFLMPWMQKKWLWPIFGCKVGQNVPIGMKLELDLWHHLLDVYTKFQIDILKHAEESPENFEKSKTHKNNRKNSENTIFVKQKQNRHLCREVYLDSWGHDCKKMNLTYF